MLRELTLSANRANASIYTLDPRGLQGVTGADRYLDQSEWRTYIQKTTSSLRYIAENTGGFPIVNKRQGGSAERVSGLAQGILAQDARQAARAPADTGEEEAIVR